MPTDTELLTVAEVQKMTRLPLSSLYKLIDNGQLPHYTVGRRIFVRRSSLMRWLDEQEHAHASSAPTHGRAV